MNNISPAVSRSQLHGFSNPNGGAGAASGTHTKHLTQADSITAGKSPVRNKTAAATFQTVQVINLKRDKVLTAFNTIGVQFAGERSSLWTDTPTATLSVVTTGFNDKWAYFGRGSFFSVIKERLGPESVESADGLQQLVTLLEDNETTDWASKVVSDEDIKCLAKIARTTTTSPMLRKQKLKQMIEKLSEKLVTDIVSRYGSSTTRPASSDTNPIASEENIGDSAVRNSRITASNGVWDDTISGFEEQIAALSSTLAKQDLTIADMVAAIAPALNITKELNGAYAETENQLSNKEQAMCRTSMRAQSTALCALKPNALPLATQHGRLNIESKKGAYTKLGALQTALVEVTQNLCNLYSSFECTLNEFSTIMTRVEAFIANGKWEYADNECRQWDKFLDCAPMVKDLNLLSGSRPQGRRPNSSKDIPDVLSEPTGIDTEKAKKNLTVLRGLIRSDERLHKVNDMLAEETLENLGALCFIATEAVIDLENVLPSPQDSQINEALYQAFESHLLRWKEEVPMHEENRSNWMDTAYQAEIGAVLSDISDMQQKREYKEIIDLTSDWIGRLDHAVTTLPAKQSAGVEARTIRKQSEQAKASLESTKTTLEMHMTDAYVNNFEQEVGGLEEKFHRLNSVPPNSGALRDFVAIAEKLKEQGNNLPQTLSENDTKRIDDLLHTVENLKKRADLADQTLSLWSMLMDGTKDLAENSDSVVTQLKATLDAVKKSSS